MALDSTANNCGAPCLPALTGKPIPLVGLGTSRTGPLCQKAVKIAIEGGYRLIDTAMNYGTEPDIGAVLEELIKEGKISREEMYIATKVSGGAAHPHRVREQTEISLKHLRTEYIDLLLIHWPVACTDAHLDDDPPEFYPRDEKGMPIASDNVDYLDTYREMEKLVDAGLVKAIGLSNFSVDQVQRVWDAARIKPSNNQIECHAWFPQNELVEFCQKKGINVSAYFPLAAPVRPSYLTPDDEVLFEEPIVVRLAEKLNRTPAQILLRYLVQRDVVVLPKSVTKERIESNIKLFDFSLSEEEMEDMRRVNRGKRLMPHPHPLADSKFK